MYLFKWRTEKGDCRREVGEETAYRPVMENLSEMRAHAATPAPLTSHKVPTQQYN